MEHHRRFINDDFSGYHIEKIFSNCTFEHVTAVNAVWQSCVFTDCSFENGTILTAATFRDCKFLHCRFVRCELAGARFYATHFEQGCIMLHCNLFKAILSQESPQQLSFNDCDMRGVELSGNSFYDMAHPMIRGRYYLFEVHEGTFGYVYGARSCTDGAAVAIKVLKHRPGRPTNTALNRFQRESQLLRSLDSQYVVKLYDQCTTDEPYFLILEYVRGSTLLSIAQHDTHLDRCTLHRLFETCFLGLQDIHTCHPQGGILHRDISMRNIIFQDGGTAKYIDFGLSKLCSRISSTSASVLGTFPFVAMEVIEARRCGRRSDMYSLAACLYYIMVGVEQLEMDALLQLSVSDSDVNCSTIEDPYRTILNRCLTANRTLRFQTAIEAIGLLRSNQPRGYTL